jgi:DNA-directed RNA polymerase subunit L
VIQEERLMEVRIIRESDTELELELVGEDHTFCNALRVVLNTNDKVLTASYKVEHPLLGNPKIYLRTKRVRVPTKERDVPLQEVKGIGSVREKQLREAGISTANELLKADIEELQKKTGLPLKVLEGYKSEAQKLDYGIETPARYVLKESLTELSRVFSELKAKFNEAL